MAQCRKIAIVHDWLVTYAGAERVLEQILLCYPGADLFCVVDFVSDRSFLHNKRPSTTFIQHLPWAKRNYRRYLPVMPFAIKQLNLSDYDLILSSSHAVAKGVKKNKRQLHLSYIYTPMRYAWDLREQYLKEAGLDRGMKTIFLNWILDRLKRWDFENTKNIDSIMTLSNYIAQRIKNNYDRATQVIYPPVDVNSFTLKGKKEDFYLTVSRFVPYKKVDLIVEAFQKMPDKKLVVIGSGPDWEKVKAKAGHNVTLMGFQESEILRNYMQRAKAFIFAAEEDFGIAVLEAQSCGTPVIAYGKGGALETVYGLEEKRPTGLFFKSQTVESLQEAIRIFEENQSRFIPEICRENALRFRPERFREEFQSFVGKKWDEFSQSQL